ncbi:MAG: GNAT family N-acetyltransferase [Anaerolineales bacterium]
MEELAVYSSQIPIFAQPWWLDAVAPGSWDEVRVERNGELYARLPYTIVRRKGFTLLSKPKLTQFLGPWLRPFTGKYVNRLAEEKELLTELIQKLPPHDIFQQNFHYSITNWLPFYWKGFSQTTFYTYVIDDLSRPDEIWENMGKNIRTDIRKAEKTLTVRDDLPLHTLLALNKMVFNRQGRALPYPPALVERIDQACATRNCRKIFFAEDHNGNPHAAVYIIWDNQSAYYLMGGGDPALRHSGATSLCLWEAIKFASTVTKKFDFEGSMIESIERFFRAFGARQIPYFHVSRSNSMLAKIGQDVLGWFRR